MAGAVLFLCNIKKRHFKFHGAVVTEWSLYSSVSLGGFIFIGRGRDDIVPHEYGHSIQSLILGPLYLLVIGLPSIVWAGFRPCENVRRKRSMSYFDFYTEKWADFLSDKNNIKYSRE